MLDTPTLLGYGGSSVAYETRVYEYCGFEVRIPRCPSVWTDDEISDAYGCIGARNLLAGTAAIDAIIEEEES